MDIQQINTQKVSLIYILTTKKLRPLGVKIKGILMPIKNHLNYTKSNHTNTSLYYNPLIIPLIFH